MIGNKTDRQLIEALLKTAHALPLICPHGHVDPRLFADADYRFGSPVDLLIIPDHYIFRMLYSQGIPLEKIGIGRRDGTPIETDHRAIWQTIADHWYLFRATPTAIWIRDELASIFGIDEVLDSANAQAIYDTIAEALARPDFTPRRLYEQFGIEVLATTDSATDTLEHHASIQQSGWHGRILPTFRPDAVVNFDHPAWHESIKALGDLTGISIGSYVNYLQAIEGRRAFFKQMGATATDHGALTPYTERLTASEADSLLQKALRGEASADDARRFTGHMLIEMARMSVDDGLVMQLHVGSYRNHNPQIFERFGADMGADIPIQTEFTRNLKPLLDAYGDDARLRLILFTLDETTYSRELAPLAGHYPSVLLGPPWWFHDSPNGMRRFFEQVTETAGIYNTAGFNDDTRAFLSIPSRHRVWRRASAEWLADLVMRHVISEDEAQAMMSDLAYGLAKRAYRLDER